MKKKEMQVLYIITKLELGGAQKICLSLFEQLQSTGHHSYLISGNQGTLAPTVSNKDNIILLDSFKREVGVKDLFKEIKTFFILISQIRKLRKKNPKLIVHTHSTKAGLLGRWAAFFANVKTRIHTVHGFGFHPYQTKIGWWINYLLEFATSFITSHYICVSSFDVKSGIRLLPRFDQKHSIIRAAVDQQAFTTAQRCTPEQTNKPFTFGTISCFKKQKNLLDLFEAFIQCKNSNPNVKLEIIGDGHMRSALERWITKNNLKESIILHGWQHNVSNYLSQWDTFVLSSLWEGLPCAVIEARLLKLPVISYDTGGIHDVIFHEQNGLLAKPKRIEELAQHMIKVSTNQQFVAQLKNYSDELSDFDQRKMIKKHIELYQLF